MKRISILLITITITITGCVNIDHFDRPEVLTQQNLLTDWQVFTDIVNSFHPGLNAYHTEAEINNFFKTQRTRINPKMDFNSFFALISESIDYIGDGHTAAMAPVWYYETEITGVLPVSISVIDGMLYKTGKETIIPEGSRITAIDSHSSSDILNELGIYVTSDGSPAENEMEILSDGFTYLYTDHYGDKQTYTISWIEPDKTDEKTKNIEAFALDFDEYEPEPITSYELKMIDKKTAYLGIHSFEIAAEEGYTGSPEEYEIFLKDSFQQLKDQGTNKLILDLRQNGGGDPLLMAQLLSYLVDENFAPDLRMFAKTQTVPLKNYILPSQKGIADDIEDELQELTKPDSSGTYSYVPELQEEEIRVEPNEDLLFRGELKVLISAYTFSAGSMCAAILEDRTDAITIGQETAGGMQRLCAAADFNYRLPNTGIELSIPTVGILINLKNTDYEIGRGVIPDLLINNRAKLLFDGRDPELEAAMMN